VATSTSQKKHCTTRRAQTSTELRVVGARPRTGDDVTTAPITPGAATTVSATPNRTGVSQDAVRSACDHSEKGATHGLALIFCLLEQRLVTLLGIAIIIALVVTLMLGGAWVTFAVALVAVPVLLVLLPIAFLVYRSRSHDAGNADWSADLVLR
jgi:hypothetical protein